MDLEELEGYFYMGSRGYLVVAAGGRAIYWWWGLAMVLGWSQSSTRGKALFWVGLARVAAEGLTGGSAGSSTRGFLVLDLQVAFLWVALFQVLPRGGPSSLIVVGYPWACGSSTKIAYLDWGLNQELRWGLGR